MGYRVLNFINFVFTFYCCFLISLENFYNRVYYKQRWILFRQVNATTVYTNRANGAFRFVLLFLFLLPCLINASVSVYVCTIFIVSSLNKVMASDARLPLKLIAQTMQKYTHICLSVKVRIFECTVAVINMSVCMCGWRATLWSFFSFALRVYVW